MPIKDTLNRYAALKDDLERCGIVSLREVEIRRRQGDGGALGERTDIYVTGYSLSSQKIIRVIIEAKGCWHDKLETAMTDQLVNRYLKDNDCQHGIYLIGWFKCNQWDTKDSRYNKSSSLSLEEARNTFNKQAKALSADGKNIKAVILNCGLR